MSEFVTLSALVDDTGQTARTLQHWADLGVLRAEPSTEKRGRGFHRVFKAAPNFGERKWALIATAMSEIRIPVGDMLIFMDVLRRSEDLTDKMYYSSSDKEEPSTDEKMARFKQSALGRALNKEEGAIVLMSVVLENGLRRGNLKALNLVTSRTSFESKGVTYEQAPESTMSHIADFIRSRRSCYLLNLSDTLKPLWA